jgi:hypothetical protein
MRRRWRQRWLRLVAVLLRSFAYLAGPSHVSLPRPLET